MKLFLPSFVLRKNDHAETRIRIRDEKAYHYRLIPYLACVNILFGFVDSISIPHESPWIFFGLRAGGVVLSYFLYRIARGRIPESYRFFLLLTPYIYPVVYIMLKYDLVTTPYFAGASLVMITSTILFPVRTRIAAFAYTLCILPVVAWLIFFPPGSTILQSMAIMMAAGAALVCIVNSGQFHSDIYKRFVAQEALARDLGRRSKEIRHKANELLKRRTFESQFSPQVVAQILGEPSSIRTMKNAHIVTIVIDIENSTAKSKSLDPNSYKAVVEEVFDVFASACLKWNVTLDKFTGDGAQAFAGAPTFYSNEWQRALQACNDSIQMLAAREHDLRALWGSQLNVRFSMVQGNALVGFIGRGSLKSYTAIGEAVSLAHRMCAIADPWSIASYSTDQARTIEVPQIGYQKKVVQISNLKGFQDRTYEVTVITPQIAQNKTLDHGRCQICETPLVLDEDSFGLPKIRCPGCDLRTNENQAA